MLTFARSQPKNNTRSTMPYSTSLWNPCSQMKDYETFKPLHVIGASGSYIHLKNGQKIIDAISSWWCKSLGHNDLRLKKALLEQVERFEHVILANTVNETILSLSEKLTQLTSTLNKVFYASDGSCAVEIAMKMSLHARKLMGQEAKQHFIALENGYHGETAAALSVSDVGLYRKDYESLLFKPHYISPLPYVCGTHDPLWQDCSSYWEPIEKSLEPLIEKTTAIILEPVVQGAAGMKIYSQDFLRRLRAWTKQHDIHLIADEIMTGIGRTGKMLACEHADIEPDFLCLSKGLTSGWLPLSAMLTSQKIYDLFYDDYSTGKAFLHSHTYTGNALAASVALQVLKIFSEEDMLLQANNLGKAMRDAMHDIADQTKKIHNIRGIGAIVAADIVCDDHKRRIGFEVYQKAVERGALLRPLGNTIYWLPPLNMGLDTLTELKMITREALML